MSLQNKQIISDVADRIGEFAVRYSDTVTMGADPGTGIFRLNNLNPTLATTMTISATDLDGSSIYQYVKNLQSGETITFIGSAGSGTLADTTKYHRFTVNGSITDNTTWFQFGITYVSHGGAAQTLANDDRCYMKFINNVAGSTGNDTWKYYWKLSASAITLATSTVYFHGDEEIYSLTTESFPILIEEDVTLVGGVSRWKRLASPAPATTNPIVIAASIDSGTSYVDVHDDWLLTAFVSDAAWNMPSGDVAIPAGSTLSFRWTTPAAWGGAAPGSAVQGLVPKFKAGI